MTQRDNPEVLDNLDFDALARKYAEMLGVPPELVRAEALVKELRVARAQAEQAMQAEQAKAMRDMAAAGKDASQTSMTNDSALTQMAAAMGEQALGAATIGQGAQA